MSNPTAASSGILDVLRPPPVRELSTAAADAYQSALDFLFRRINYEKLLHDRAQPIDFKLDRMRELLARLGNPQERLPVVHITGTKGKGSTAAMIAHILECSGQRVGLYTSPHMRHIEERMTVNGRQPDAAEFTALVQAVQPVVRSMDALPGSMAPTYFEITTALAWLHFASAQVDLVVLEVGLGGRLDSTNICRPRVCLITSISRDHMRLLGATLRDIAREKAGIAKPDILLLSGATDPEARAAIADVCHAHHAPLHELDESIQLRRVDQEVSNPRLPPRYRIDVESPWGRHADLSLALPGIHQTRNAALAVAAIDVLRSQGQPVTDADIRTGLATLRWPLRLEVVREQPTWIVDAAHNDASIQALADTLAQIQAQRRVVIFGTSRDKETADLLRRLDPVGDAFILTRYENNPRALPVEELAGIAAAVLTRPIERAASPAEAVRLAETLAGPEDLVCITGSFFLAAEVRDLLRAMPEYPRLLPDRPPCQCAG